MFAIHNSCRNTSACKGILLPCILCLVTQALDLPMLHPHRYYSSHRHRHQIRRSWAPIIIPTHDSLPSHRHPIPHTPSAPPTQQQRPPAPTGLAYPSLSRHPNQGVPASLPHTLQHVGIDRFRTPSQESARIIRDRVVDDDRVPDLKTVLLPRDCLPRFLSIAALNTARNCEACGLLLGKDQGGKYVVTVLLIPRQHSTSDTCTMDDEELVMQFTEERSLITLGWVSTHWF